MPEVYNVKENDTLLSISKSKGFKTIEAIIKANIDEFPYLKEYPEIIAPGMQLIIPDKSEKQVTNHTGTENQVVVKVERDIYLWITFEDPYCFIDVDKCELEISGAKVASEKYAYQNENAKESRLVTLVTIDKIKKDAKQGKAIIFLDKFGNKSKQEIKIEIGGLDPISMTSKKGKKIPEISEKKAIQKLLTNLRYYSGPIDGNLDSNESKEAIASFQDEHNVQPIVKGIIDNPTAAHLILQSKIPGMYAHVRDSASKNPQSDFRTPLFENKENINCVLDSSGIDKSIKDYFDPENFDPLKGHPERKPIKDFKVKDYSETIYVLPTKVKFEEKQDHNYKIEKERKIKTNKYYKQPKVAPRFPNLVKSYLQKYVFLDCGKWKGEYAQFGVVWGRHVYLCELNNSSDLYTMKFNRQSGLDYNFFKKTNFFKSPSNTIYNVRIIKHAFCSWGHDVEYDFSNLHIIIPDMHLLAPSVVNIWQGGSYTLNAEIKLFDFARHLASLKKSISKLKIIQLGDSYDLWIDTAMVPQSVLFKLVGEIADLIIDSTKDINQLYNQSWQLIAEKAILPLYVENSNLQMKIVSGENDLYTFDRNKLRENLVKIKANPLTTLITREQIFKKMVLDAFTKVDNPKQVLTEQIMRIQGLMEDEFNNPSLMVNQVYTKNWLSYLGLRKGNEHLDQFMLSINYQKKLIYVNPATAALQLLEFYFGNDLIYIYGNHDNYLADSSLTQEIKFNTQPMKPRKLLYQSKSLYIEHGHRNEFEFERENPGFYKKDTEKVQRFAEQIKEQISARALEIKLTIAAFNKGGVPVNYDGAMSGFQATCGNFAEKLSVYWLVKTKGKIIEESADTVAGNHDQPSYKKTFSRIKIGRASESNAKVPNIFVIGHTHVATLEIVTIKGIDEIRKEKVEKEAEDKLKPKVYFGKI